MKTKIAILNYQDFARKHRKYSHSVAHNMFSHGYHCLEDFDLEDGERSRDAVRSLLEHYGGDFSEVVYYRTQNAWGLPYLFVYVKKGEL